MEGARLHIIVTPPFWKTKWFLFFGLATIISATAGGMSVWNKERLRKQRQHYELETIQQQAEYQRQLEITRIQSEAQAHEHERIFRDIHDGLGAQIVEIAAMAEQLKSELPPPEEFLTESIQNEWVQAIMLSVYELRGSLREIVWLLNMENDSLEALIAYLRQETTRMLENASLNVSFSIDHTLPNDVNVHPDVRRNVVMAVREACANIVKHAGASAVEIDTHLADGTLTLTLRDNGFGFVPENVRRFSNGMKIMQKRMALCGGSMTLDSAPNAGTTIVFSVPC
jgi:signal transduction histidine kinase